MKKEKGKAKRMEMAWGRIGFDALASEGLAFASSHDLTRDFALGAWLGKFRPSHNALREFRILGLSEILNFATTTSTTTSTLDRISTQWRSSTTSKSPTTVCS